MVLKVKHDELENVNKTLKNDGETLNKEIINMEKEVERLRGIWIGTDAVALCNNFQNYLSKMKGIPVALNNMSIFVEKANGGYKENDEKFSKELEKEAYNYDEDRVTDN